MRYDAARQREAPMAEPEKRVRNGRVRWYARYYDPSGKQLSKTFDRRVDARRFLRQVETSIKDTNSYIDPTRSKIMLGVFADKWLATQGHLKTSTYARYEGIVTKWIKPRWGNVPLSKVAHADVAEWISGIRLSAASVQYIHRVMYLILELAVRDGRIPRNPAHGVRLPKNLKSEKVFLTRDQVFALADAAAQYPIPEIGGQYRALVLVLAFCGLRWGEAAGLKVGRVDLLRRRLTIAETLSEVGGRLVWGTPKSHAARSVPIPSFVVDLLAEVTAERSNALDSSALVFTTWRGRPLRNLNFRRDVFDRAAGDAGLAGLTPHELRHTAASLAVSAGANVKAVQRMLGHASAAMTLDVYSGLFDDDLDGVAERLNRAATADKYPLSTNEQRAEVIELRKPS
jgi:integrase